MMKSSPTVRATRAIIFALCLMASTIAPAGADNTAPRQLGPQYPELSGPNVVSFDVSSMPPLTNPQQRIIQRTSGPQGCAANHQTSHVRPTPGAPVTVIRELAFDPSTCRYLEDTGTLANPPANSPSLTSTPTLPVAARRPGHSASPNLSGYQYGYQYSVQWYDPVGIEVSHADPYAGWNSNGSTVYNCAGNTATGWYATSGWWEKSKSISVEYTSGSSGCESDGYVTHENNVFCSMVTTDIYYQPVIIYGWWDGTVSTNTTTWDAGGCYTWLHYQIVSPYPI